MAKKTEVAKTTEDPNAVPSYLKDYQDQHADDGFGAEDITLPMVKLLQGTSEEITVHDNAKPGTFWHTGADENLGESIQFIPISRSKMYLLQTPMIDSQGVIARAMDAKTWDRTGSWEVKIDRKTTVTWTIDDLDVAASGLTAFGTSDPDDENSPPAATLFYRYLVLIRGREELGPCVLLLARTMIKRARKGLNDKIAHHKSHGRPMQALVFEARAAEAQNDAGQDYNVMNFYSRGFATEEEFSICEAASEQFENYSFDEGHIDNNASSKADSDKF